MFRIAIIIVLLTSIGRPFIAGSQTLHTPAQILDIMHRSSVNYTVDSLEMIVAKRLGKILTRKDVASQYSSLPSAGTSPKGAADLNIGDCSKAIKFLIKKTENYKELSFNSQLDFCDCLQKSGEWELSLQVLQHLDAKGQGHFEILRKMARAYSKTGKGTQAYEKILQAWILNRNHSLLRNEVIAYGSAVGVTRPDWEWSPKVNITKTASGPRVSIGPPNTWLAYGLCEAVWQFEPGYAELMGHITDKGPAYIQATECLMNAMIAYAANDQRYDELPEMEALKRAVERQLTSAFILFELQLPQNPMLAYGLSEQELNNIATYLSTCR